MLTHSICGGAADQELLRLTIGAAFDQVCERFPDTPGLIVDHQGIEFSYTEYREQVERLAAGLLGIGIETGDRVGIWSPNCYEWCLTQFATAKIGAILVCINPAYRVHELEYALNKVECKVLVLAECFRDLDYLKMLHQLAPELEYCRPGRLQSAKLPHLRHIISLGANPVAGMHGFSSLRQPISEQERRSLAARQATLHCEDPINIQFTSGTTGTPKGATLSHHNILNNARFAGSGMRLTEQDKLCIPVPLYHCFGMVLGNLACITHGATAVFPQAAFEPSATLRVVAQQRCTALHGVPTMFIAMLNMPDFDQFDLASLRTGIMAGAPCPTEVMKRVIRDMHMRDVLIAYGQTECSPVNHMTTDTDPVEQRVGSVGRPAPRLEIKIVDDTGAVAPVGVKGEICCRGYAVMQGYWGDERQTGEAIDADGWLHSGDLGIMDAQGYVEVVGRIKDMIIRGGENIYPREVEDLLCSHEQVLDAHVFGIPDPKYGEQVCAWIATRDDSDLEEEEIIAWCRERISRFKVPSRVRFVDEFPMTVTGKIQKFRMREAMVEELSGINTSLHGTQIEDSS